MRWVFGWATSLALLVGSTAAAAQHGAPPAEGVRTHDGFFLRIGSNVGPLIMTHQHTTQAPERTLETEYGGLTFGQDFMFGGTLGDGLVIGGGLMAAMTWPATATAEYKTSGKLTSPTGPVLFTGLAAFANYYFDPKGGFHLQALLGLSMVHQPQISNSSPWGPMIGVGVGFDFFVADEWSVGPFARVLYAPSSDERDMYDYRFPSIGAAITLH
jgi:hypothetical protein